MGQQLHHLTRNEVATAAPGRELKGGLRNHNGAALQNKLRDGYFLKMALIMAEPILRSNPLFVRGMPVFLEILRFTSEMPKARFQEKLTPGIFIGI